MNLQIRLATLGDLEAIRAIYNHYVLHCTCTYQLEPDTAQERLTWFTSRSEAHPVTVAECDGEVIGWAALSPWKSRGGYAHSVEASVYVHHERHRRGVGRALLVELIERARALGHRTILGGTSADQVASLALQDRLGFVTCGHLRQVGYKFGRWLDVIYKQLLLTNEGPAEPEKESYARIATSTPA